MRCHTGHACSDNYRWARARDGRVIYDALFRISARAQISLSWPARRAVTVEAQPAAKGPGGLEAALGCTRGQRTVRKAMGF